MSSTNKTTLGLNRWESSDKPVRLDFVNDNTIIDQQITKLKYDISMINLATSLNTGTPETVIELSQPMTDYRRLLITFNTPASTNSGTFTGILYKWGDWTPGYYSCATPFGKALFYIPDATHLVIKSIDGNYPVRYVFGSVN